MVHAYHSNNFATYQSMFKYYSMLAQHDSTILKTDMFFKGSVFYINRVYNLGFPKVIDLFTAFLADEKNVELYEISKVLYKIHDVPMPRK